MNMKFMIMKQARYLISALPSGDCDSRGKRVEGEGKKRRRDRRLDSGYLGISVLYIVYCILWVNQNIPR
jgi:hypothetical protein